LALSERAKHGAIQYEIYTLASLTRPAYTSRDDISSWPMRSDDSREITRTLIELRIEHRDLDAAINRMVEDSQTDEVQIKRLKKRKLKLKDMIAYYENKLIPDEPA
jgi:hypothetical protein